MKMFRNIEFCNSDCVKTNCRRFITKEIVEESKKSIYFFYTSDFSSFCDKYETQPNFQKAYITGEIE